MRRTLKFGIGVGTAAIVATMSAGVAAATTSGQQHAGGPVAAVSAVNRHVTRAEARKIAKARVPHSRAIEVESDDLRDRAVWKVQLATPQGRVVVDVDKKTGSATIVRHGGGRDAAVATSLASHRSDVGDNQGAGAVADDHGRDAGDNDGARDERADRRDDGRGDRHNDGRGDRRDDGRGDQSGHGHDHGGGQGDDGSRR